MGKKNNDLINFHDFHQMIEVGEFETINGDRLNVLIEGDNLEVLKLLEKNLKGKIDVICIDPPYNTGMTSLTYNDYNFTDQIEPNDYQSWLEFIQNRIKISYELLTSNGVIFLNIDENEIANLILLCQNVFGKTNVDIMIWPKTDPNFDQNRIEKNFHNIKVVHEFIIVCFKNKEETNLNMVKTPSNDYQYLETIVSGYGTTSSAKDELEVILGDRKLFQTPKPMRLVKELIRASSNKKSLILDYFAGSGTTGHAVMDLNKEDGGERRFILVNNNENEICKNITYPRLKNVIKTENYKEMLKYYQINT